MTGAGAEPGQQVEAGRHLAKAGEMMLDEKGAVKAERLGFDIVIDELAEALAAVRVGTAAPCLRAAEQSKTHRLLLLGNQFYRILPRAAAPSSRFEAEVRTGTGKKSEV